MKGKKWKWKWSERKRYKIIINKILILSALCSCGFEFFYSAFATITTTRKKKTKAKTKKIIIILNNFLALWSAIVIWCIFMLANKRSQWGNERTNEWLLKQTNNHSLPFHSIVHIVCLCVSNSNNRPHCFATSCTLSLSFPYYFFTAALEIIKQKLWQPNNVDFHILDMYFFCFQFFFISLLRTPFSMKENHWVRL